eukprot:14023468-Alexandrium_andersonii.AAC.1
MRRRHLVRGAHGEEAQDAASCCFELLEVFKASHSAGVPSLWPRDKERGGPAGQHRRRQGEQW